MYRLNSIQYQTTTGYCEAVIVIPFLKYFTSDLVILILSCPVRRLQPASPGTGTLRLEDDGGRLPRLSGMENILEGLAPKSFSGSFY